MDNLKDENHPSINYGRLSCDATFLFLRLRYSFIFLILPTLIFSARKLAIFLQDTGLAASK
jgi:hypothetical protein